MAKKVAKFYKVSFEQFMKDFLDTFNEVNMLKYGIPPYSTSEAAVKKSGKILNFQNVKLLDLLVMILNHQLHSH